MRDFHRSNDFREFILKSNSWLAGNRGIEGRWFIAPSISSICICLGMFHQKENGASINGTNYLYCAFLDFLALALNYDAVDSPLRNSLGGAKLISALNARRGKTFERNERRFSTCANDWSQLSLAFPVTTTSSAEHSLRTIWEALGRVHESEIKVYLRNEWENFLFIFNESLQINISFYLKFKKKLFLKCERSLKYYSLVQQFMKVQILSLARLLSLYNFVSQITKRTQFC